MPTPPAPARPSQPLSVAALALAVAGALVLAVGLAPAAAQSSDTTLPPQGGMGTVAPIDPGVRQISEVYRTVDGEPLEVVIHLPASTSQDTPAIVLIHGGGWISGDPTDMDTWADLFADAGWMAFSVGYRTATADQSAWPEAFEDVTAGLQWVHQNAERFGADPARLAVFGESAGAHLAVLLAVADHGVPVDVVASWSAPLHLAGLVPGADGAAPPDCGTNEQCTLLFSEPLVTEFLGCTPDACPDTYREASPSGQAHGGMPAVWMANGSDEAVPAPPAQQFATELADADVRHELRIVPGKAHAHGYGTEVWNEMVAWMADELDVAQPAPVDFGDASSGPPVWALAVGGLVVIAVALGSWTVLRRRGTARP